MMEQAPCRPNGAEEALTTRQRSRPDAIPPRALGAPARATHLIVMAHEACTRLLQWALPRLGMRWRGFRCVRRQVCRRIEARRHALDLPDLDAYRARLEDDPAEWARLDLMCRVTISRFWRNHVLFDALPEVLAALAVASRPERLRIWSAGCASGEEAYSVSIAGAAFDLEIVATDGLHIRAIVLPQMLTAES